ncbi:MAG: bifunctional glutamate N-acetyltransferase/amino-acid acetyltransferase ArgJ [Elusimicrobia bacterium]|nr:bifunctional glutamate N-acetyltransferase/amino-acid acetyltransferase ArgJ [Elusimicrobiota bacterium]
MIQEIAGGVTAANGYKAAGLHCGIKRAKKDLALLVSERPAACGAVFTQNAVPGAPVTACKEQLAASRWIRAVSVNSGNANACTGARGLEDARTMIAQTALVTGLKKEEVLVSSTGVIGQYLPMEKIIAGLAEAVPQLSAEGGRAAAEAIMTTDTFVKELAVTVRIDGAEVKLGGMAKGSGMIAPNMATMLAFISTDAAITPELLQRTVKDVVDRSFNRITVDGDTSTNDMVVVLANGLAGNAPLASETDPGYAEFTAALEHLLVRLSKMIVMDGEGATKFVEVQVVGAASQEDAVAAARAIASSNLVKTAINGEDANWGRIMAAVGNSGIGFTPEETEILFGDVPILKKNYVIDFSEERAKEVLQKKELTIRVQLNGGPGEATFWTCDLSKEYVAINANYRT